MGINVLFGIIGGLGLFLYGIHLMGTALQKVTGDKIKKIAGILTDNKFLGVLLGIFVTGIVQSSSITTVMLVGFVNAGILKLTQSLGLIMGANIGTTLTAQMISFSFEDIVPILIGIGMVLHLSSNKERTKQLGEALIGLGILFLGMDFLRSAVKPLENFETFRNILISFGHNPVLGILIGIALSIILQSSTAAIGLLIALASQGLIPLVSALPILYGENIGTCTTALISSIGANKDAKRAASLHILFNLVGTILFTTILYRPMESLIVYINPNDISRQIANAHTLFNITSTILIIPFSAQLIKLSKVIIKDENDENEYTKISRYLDDRMLKTPTIALESAVKETLYMAEIAKDSFQCAMNGFLSRSKDEVLKVFEKEKIINEFEKNIISYMIKLSNASMCSESRETMDGLFNIVNDVERIGDHSENIAELAVVAIDKHLAFSEEAIKDLNNMYTRVLDVYELSIKAMKQRDVRLSLEIMKLEEKIDILERLCRKNHIYRLNTKSCHPESGIVFLDLISNMERIADHASNIARTVIDSKR
ncbi:Na/Pi cotransporter family protein [Alkalithermobacter paradoxus]|uniref:Transcriptional regulator PhoU n=1 Tax=Alkalithermobacter paradoxus TaxID=29349 RepID=A0A1V4IA08_9FIRM|nr:transcriptional regulator PhoU [[Clostridium] thermoalcaliphilum]